MKKWIICIVMAICLFAAGCPRHWARPHGNPPPKKVWVKAITIPMGFGFRNITNSGRALWWLGAS